MYANFSSHDAGRALASGSQSSMWRWLVEVLLIFGVFFLHGAWPTPDSNETNYVIKAKHFWEPGIFPNDFFIQSKDAHGVYFFTFGWVAQFLSLDATAWVGRILTWALLAMAWRGLSFAAIPRNWVSVLSAQLFVMLTEQAHMAGEWIVGGVEGKGFAYVLILWSLQALVRSRWNLVWLLAGAAMSFHMVVGGWTILLLVLVWLVSAGNRVPLRTMLPGLVGGALLALPGVWFGLSLTMGADAEVVTQANVIQVFERLPHHLLPQGFKEGFVQRQLLLWVVFLLLCSVTPTTLGDRRLRWFIGGAMLLAVIGFAVACLAVATRDSQMGNFACNVLRYYWFRMSDIMVPLGVALVGMQYVMTGLAQHHVRQRWSVAVLVAVSVFDLVKQTAHLPAPLNPYWSVVPARPDERMVYEDWLAVCRWAADSTPPGTLFLTPRSSVTFKWHSGRDEVVTMKDMPQDAASVVAWWERLRDIHGHPHPEIRPWFRSLAERSFEQVQQLGRKYRADYAVVELLPDVPRWSEKPVYENKTYAVYRIEKSIE